MLSACTLGCLAISYYWVCVCLRNVNTTVMACMGDFFHYVFLQSCVYAFLCVQAGEFDIRKRLKAYIALNGGTYICFALLSFTFLSCLFLFVFVIVCWMKRGLSPAAAEVYTKELFVFVFVEFASVFVWRKWQQVASSFGICLFPYKMELLGSFTMCEMVEFIKKSSKNKMVWIANIFSIHLSYEGWCCLSGWKFYVCQPVKEHHLARTHTGGGWICWTCNVW